MDKKTQQEGNNNTQNQKANRKQWQKQNNKTIRNKEWIKKLHEIEKRGQKKYARIKKEEEKWNTKE